MSGQSYYSGASGWYCSNCGAFVPINTTHQCPTRPESTGNIMGFATSLPSNRDLLLQILAKLDEILKELKRI